MLEVLAFEGNPNPQDGVTWGTAAVNDGRRIYNSLTRLEVSRQDIDAFIHEGTLVPLPQPMQLPDEFSDQHIIIISVDQSEPASTIVGSLESGAYTRQDDGAHVYFCYTDAENFKAAATRATNCLVEKILYDEWRTPSATVLLRAGLTLDSSSPGLNAIWAYQNQGKQFVRQLAEKNVEKGGCGREDFDKLYFDLCCTEHPEAELSYDGGDATGGGFSLPMSTRILSSLQKIIGFEAIELQNSFAFLREIKQPELHEQRAASVHWKFRLSEDGEPFGDTLARVMVWNKIQGVVTRGETGEEASSLQDAYQTIVMPSSGVQLTLSSSWSAPQQVAPLTVSANALRWSKQLSKSDAQIKTSGGKIEYLRFTKSAYNIEFRTWFRDCLFHNQNWQNTEWMGKIIEGADVKFSTTLNGVFIGNMVFRITHDPDRASSHSHPPTWLHWNDQLLSALNSGYYAFYWVWIEHIDEDLSLTIDALPPPWDR